MPTYSYHCDTCGHDFEAVQRFADEPLTACPECGSPIRRVIQPVGVVFKGSGWYITDSRKAASDGAERPAKGKAAEKAAKSEGSSTGEKAESAKAEKTPAKVAE